MEGWYVADGFAEELDTYITVLLSGLAGNGENGERVQSS